LLPLLLPLLLTFTLIRSSTLMVSTFGVRSYSDQRYRSVQTSDSEHASRASELTAGLTAFCTASVGFAAATSTGGVAGCGLAGGGSDKAALPRAISATETSCSPCAVARGTSTCSTRAIAEVAGLTAIGASVLAKPSASRPASPVPIQPARATAPHN